MRVLCTTANPKTYRWGHAVFVEQTNTISKPFRTNWPIGTHIKGILSTDDGNPSFIHWVTYSPSCTDKVIGPIKQLIVGLSSNVRTDLYPNNAWLLLKTITIPNIIRSGVMSCVTGQLTDGIIWLHMLVVDLLSSKRIISKMVNYARRCNCVYSKSIVYFQSANV